ncbi:MAG TPA: FtsX-like permease family protein [Fimbriimonadales bacterium]|nr:FtsX-like permease family protein [Fimbriimonadales bacterium]
MSSKTRIGSPPTELSKWLRSKEGLGSAGEVRKETYPLTIPDPTAKAKAFTPHGNTTLFPLWPNGVRTSSCDLTGNLIYVGDGGIERYEGKKVDGSIVLMDFNSETNWLIAARLGAKAAIFLEPDATWRSQGEMLWSNLPLDFPRFWVSREDAKVLFQSLDKQIRVHCNQKWIEIEAENLFVTIPGSDPGFKNEWILIGAYSDSISVVPGLPHGAEQACSAAALIEIAHFLKKNKPKRSVLLLLTSGHFQAMQGIRQFLEKRFEDNWKITNYRIPQFAYFLDLSSHSTGVVPLGFGWWVEYRWEVIQEETAVARFMRERIPEIARTMQREEREIFYDGVNNPDGRAWKNNILCRIAHEGEIANLAGLNMISFVTSEDARYHQDTPFDNLENVNLPAFCTQLRTILCLLDHLLNDSQNESLYGDNAVPYRGGSEFLKMSLKAGFSTIAGQVLTYDPRRSFLPDIPVRNALVVLENRYPSYAGIRGAYVARAYGKEARYRLLGIPPVTAFYPLDRFPISLWAYEIGKDGEIIRTLDFNEQHPNRFPTTFFLNTAYREVPIAVFSCLAWELYGLRDSLSMQSLTVLKMLDGRNNGDPRRYSLQVSQRDYRWREQPLWEDGGVFFGIENDRFKIVGKNAANDTRLLLTNSNQEIPEGTGFPLSKRMPVFSIALQSAVDIYTINEERLALLRKHRILNKGIEDLHGKAWNAILSAKKAYEQKHYALAERDALEAWGYAARVHPLILSTTKDIVNGLVFYLFLIMPFCYFLERLFFGFKKLLNQLLASSSIFIATFFALRYLHPAFDLSGNTFMIFVAFTMGALSLIVITFVFGKFESSLLLYQRESEGTHEHKLSRVSILFTALQIGINNMRRRPMRTTLTGLTLVLVTFAMLSFTSIITDLRFNEIEEPGKPQYPGILLRDVKLQPLDDVAYRILLTEFGDEHPVVRRVWFYGAQGGAQSVLPLHANAKMVEVNAILGLESDERHVLAPHLALLPGGRWFEKGERDAIILPRSVAERLAILPDDVNHTLVRLGGMNFRLVGIADDLALKKLNDLDQESFMPADFDRSGQLQQRGQGGDASFLTYVRLDPSQIAILPAQTTLEIGGVMRTIAVSFSNHREAENAMRALLPRVNRNLYGSALRDGKPVIRRFSSVAATQGTGFEYVLIPAILAAIIMLNTMIASVIEREREIGIFSAIGLSPRNISSLFFAEALVYAILGVVGGYIFAQIVGKFVGMTNLFPEIYLNFSSMSAFVSVLMVIFVVFSSTIYPAKIASRIATSAGQEWVITTPESDEWKIPLPFTTSREQSVGLARYYEQWLKAFEEYAIGEFVTTDVETQIQNGYLATSARCWLAPYDLGVQQKFEIVFEETEIPGIFGIALNIHRFSGDPEHWESLNRRFIGSLRQQFLIWRSLTKEQQEEYLRMGNQ